MSRSLEVREIARDALAVSTDVLGCESGAVYITEESGEYLELAAAQNLSPQFVDAVRTLPTNLILPNTPENWEEPRQWLPPDLLDGPVKAAALAEGLVSVITVPLVAKDRLTGSMSLSCMRPRTLAPEEAGLLIALGRQIGVGIENARLYEREQDRRDEAERRRRVAEGLREILSVLNSGQSLQETLDLIAWQACHVLGADGAALMRLNVEDGIMVPQAHHGLTEPFVSNLRIRTGQVASGRALAQGTPVLVSDTAAFLEILRANDELPATMPLAVVEEIVTIFKALLTVPVFIGDRAYGTLSLYYHESRAFDQEDIELVQTMADQAALAIEAARLREQAKTSAATEERNRLARELHDSVTQNLYSVTLYAEAAARLLAVGQAEQAADHLRNLRDTSQEALREMRLLIFELRPMDLQKMGLAGAIQARLQAVETRGGIQAQLLQEGVEYAPLVSHTVQEELYHIAQEALNNTLKHSHAGRVVVSLTYGPRVTQLRVRDDGVGFELEAAAEAGGLGLRGMRERVQRIDGCLTIESAPGQGATIIVDAPGDGVGPALLRRTMAQKIRVMLVDDHAIVRKGIAALLATEPDFEVVGEASDGAEAIARAQALRPDVVMMDLVMPKIDGIEATRQITSQLKSVRVLVLTSFAADDKVFPAIKAGALGYLLKDSGPLELVQAIRQVHRGQPSLEPSIASKVLFELAHPSRDPLTTDPLTGREMEVLRLVAQGRSNREISEKLVITELTVSTHVSNILGKLHLASRTQAALFALREGLASLDDIPSFGDDD